MILLLLLLSTLQPLKQTDKRKKSDILTQWKQKEIHEKACKVPKK